MGDDNEGRYAAMVEFLGTFPTLSSLSPPNSLSDLSDGVVLFEVLSEMYVVVGARMKKRDVLILLPIADYTLITHLSLLFKKKLLTQTHNSAPDYFDPTTIARHLGDNWALKSSNLRKLLRNLEYYYHEELKKDADFEEQTSALGIIAKSGDPAAIASLVELVAAAAVTCERKGEFVGRIMSMTPESQLHMKGIIQSSLARLDDFDTESDEEGVDNEMVFGEGNSDDKDMDEDILFDKNHLKTGGAGGTMTDAEKEDLERTLLEARRELAQHKSQSSELREDNEKSQSKLRALVEDLQDRLARRQDELIDAEEELRTMTNDFEDAKSRLVLLEEEKAQLADELDVASAKANQLHKAEATVLAYRKKLEGVGVMNQQMTDLEDQAAGYLSQIMDLESEVKKTNTLQRHVDSLQEKLGALEKEKTVNTDSLKSTSSEVADLKSRLNAAESAKKLYESELAELRAQQSVEPVDDLSLNVEGLSIDGSQNIAAVREKAMRLEIANKKLTEEVDSLKAGGATASAVASVGSEALSSELKNEVQRLKAELTKKEAENKKIGGDKDKLEAYTKRTLAKFQDKYLVALQECKAKLREKQDKIEILESRSATEKTAQKREERLLSSTIYELGLAIMQHRLKER
jgi:protein HOOK3